MLLRATARGQYYKTFYGRNSWQSYGFDINLNLVEASKTIAEGEATWFSYGFDINLNLVEASKTNAEGEATASTLI
jgi:hypothetical protein